MDLNKYIDKYFCMLSYNDLSEKNNFKDYNNFKDFIVGHYNLNHMKLNNYIKYVKVKRQIIILTKRDEYINLLAKINSIINIMHTHSIFPKIDIKKYLFKMNVLFRLIEEKKNNILQSINSIRDLYEIQCSNIKFNFKILIYINTLIYKFKIYNKNSKDLIDHVNKLIEIENDFDIDHKLIDLNNIERSFLGKKSEYTANKIILEFISILNKTDTNKKYYYEINIDILKLLNINSNHEISLKGEVDGMIISYDGKEYIIEKIIEVKSSIKATFEDIKKFISLQKYMSNIDLNKNITYQKYIFTKNSFVNMLHKNISDWTIYICINGHNHDIIEKSHLYFSSVLKILDNDFIKDFYIDNNEYVIEEKYKIIEENTLMIDNMFNEWVCNTNFGTNKCNIYIVKK
jgi:hypothetical protein